MNSFWLIASILTAAQVAWPVMAEQISLACTPIGGGNPSYIVIDVDSRTVRFALDDRNYLTVPMQLSDKEVTWQYLRQMGKWQPAYGQYNRESAQLREWTYPATSSDGIRAGGFDAYYQCVRGERPAKPF